MTRFSVFRLLDSFAFPIKYYRVEPDLFYICFRRGRSQSCPFCRDSLKRVNSGDLWIYTEKCDAIDLSSILREDRKRLFMYIDKLPLVVPDPVFLPFDSHVR